MAYLTKKSALKLAMQAPMQTFEKEGAQLYRCVMKLCDETVLCAICAWGPGIYSPILGTQFGANAS